MVTQKGSQMNGNINKKEVTIWDSYFFYKIRGIP